MSTSEAQVYARALYDALMSGAVGALRAAAARLEGASGDLSALDQRIAAALPPEAPREVRNVLLMMAREGALEQLPAVVQAFEASSRQAARPLTGEVISAIELNNVQRAEITKELRARYGDGLDLQFNVDPSLIGGLIIRIGDQVLDNSLRARLSAIHRNMLTS